MKNKNTKKPAPKADTAKSELNGNAAVLGSPLQQVWKKKRGFCLVKGCRNKADKGHFCSGHASARSRLKAKGEPVEEPVDFEAVAAAQPKVKKAAKPKAAKKAAPAKKSDAPKVATKPKAAKPKAKKAKAAPAPEAAPAVDETVNGATPAAAPSDDQLL